ncbi:serine/threonine-protein kinase [Microcoleus sp. D3_18a_C4]|uniref:serine/threonine-protein kinase n=1 Tax=unclassified Microcoleus TaxID=2642155 RepID=UPI002FD5F98C
MTTFPDFSTHGYQVTRELGYNSLGGRVTYLATETNTNKSVVIKQFQFAQGSSWAKYSASQQETQVLKKLDHPGIPRYLDDFQTDSGFCIVQEYINAQSACDRTFSLPDIKKIAIATLEILAYLQSQKLPVIHRDIKPENLLIDNQLNVYLVDFGFARIGGGYIAASSVVKGTMGFMPPEQMFNRELTKASDLYGLGITLICLLTGTKSAEVGNLIDANYGIHFRHLVPPLQQGWMNWLEKMVAPRIQDRYQSAADALAALESLDVKQLPKVRLALNRLELTATGYGEILAQNIAISNPIPDTMLGGRWEVAPHPNDPPHTPYDHSWISFEPQSFESNNIECQIRVDTQKLLASQTYNRQIILHANSEPETHTIELQVTTSALHVPKKNTSLSARRLAFMCCFTLAGFMISELLTNLINSNNVLLHTFSWWVPLVVLFGFNSAENTITVMTVNPNKLKDINVKWLDFRQLFKQILKVILGSSVVIIIFTLMFFLSAGIKELPIIIDLIINIISATISSCGGIVVMVVLARYLIFLMMIDTSVNNLVAEQASRKIFKADATKISFLTVAFCTLLGATFRLFFKLGNQLEWVEPIEIIATVGVTLLPLVVIAIALVDTLVFNPKRIISNYRKSEQNLIRP